MSIASEITRLQGAKSDLKDAIEGKGVTVPSATKLDGYADLVDAISQGGGTLGTKIITANGQYDASDDGYDGYSEIDVTVPNTYSAGDEGKVVSNGALVAQTAHADVTPTTSDQTIDTTLNNSLKVKGDADLIAGNIKKDVDIFGVTGNYEGGGGGSLENEIISGALSGSYQNSDVTAIRTQAFRKFNSVTSVSFPNVTSIGAEAFRENTGITSVSFPKATTIGGTAFYGCTALASVFFPLATSFSSYCCYGCTSLRTAVGPVC